MRLSAQPILIIYTIIPFVLGCNDKPKGPEIKYPAYIETIVDIDAPSTKTLPIKDEKTNEIKEALFLSIIKRSQHHKIAIFIDYGNGMDPPDDFMARFDGIDSV